MHAFPFGTCWYMFHMVSPNMRTPEGHISFPIFGDAQITNSCSWICLKTLFIETERFDVYENQYDLFAHCNKNKYTKNTMLSLRQSTDVMDYKDNVIVI